MRYQVDTLSGAPLDLAVAMTEGYGPAIRIGWDCFDDWADANDYRPSTDWATGGPIVGRERIEFRWSEKQCHAWSPRGGVTSLGETELIARLRAYVKSRHGDYIDLEGV